MTAYYGAFLQIKGRLCVVIGGGPVAYRKVRKLLDAGARVRLVSPDLVTALSTEAAQNRIEYVQRTWRPGDTEGAFLTYACTNDRDVNQCVAHEVTARGGLVNVADDPSLCTFIVPALWSSAGLQVAISTGGEDPRAAKRMRAALEHDVSGGVGAFSAAIRNFCSARLQEGDQD